MALAGPQLERILPIQLSPLHQSKPLSEIIAWPVSPR
jgi:hypothetical protein